LKHILVGLDLSLYFSRGEVTWRGKMSLNLRLLIMRFRHGKLSPVLRYCAFLFYVLVVLFVGQYVIRTYHGGGEGGGFLPSAQRRVYSREELPKIVRDFEDLVVPGYGDFGKGVSLREQSQEDIQAQLKKYSYNKHVSDKISLRRTLPDTRHSECRRIDYGPKSDLPKASVILIFCNETMSALMRTVWSVIDTSPPELLHEIVLIDDGSGTDEITKLLPEYLKYRLDGYNVHLHRYEKQGGLIFARQEGAKHSSGDLLIFLDSHCESTKGWLEPLAYHIKQHPKAVAIPSIDSIDHTSLEFHGSPGGVHISVGGFTWSGHFTWESYKGQGSRKASDPAPTPTMAGGLFAMSRDYYWEVGGYDEGMIGWGGENLEMSFRVWQCHGRMDAIPCSHVGHIFRDTHPYFIPDDSHGRNTMRMAEVWMDDYKRLFYMHRVDLKSQHEVGDVSSRVELRNKLQCHNFKWFLDNVIPHKFIMDEQSLYYGRLKTLGYDNICVDHLQRDQGQKFTPYALGQYVCHPKLGSSQYFTFSKKQELRNEYMCAEVRNGKVQMFGCHGGHGQLWSHSQATGLLKHEQSDTCLSSPPDKPENMASGQELIAVACSNMDNQQLWKFDFANNE